MSEQNFTYKNLFFKALQYSVSLAFIIGMQYIGGKQSGIIGITWLLLATIPLGLVLWSKKEVNIDVHTLLKMSKLTIYYFLLLVSIQVLHPLLFIAFKLGFPIVQRVSFLLFLPFELFIIFKILKNK